MRSCTACATHCNTLQLIATPCNTLQHTATHCNTLPYQWGRALYAAEKSPLQKNTRQNMPTCCRCVAVCCSGKSRKITTHCNTLYSRKARINTPLLTGLKFILFCWLFENKKKVSVLLIYFFTESDCSGEFLELLCVAVCCSVLQCVAVCCSVL